MATDYGSDLDCVTDVTDALTEISGPLVVAQAIARMLQTPPVGPGSLPYAQGWGHDVRQYHQSSTPLSEIEARVELAVVSDERVLEATVTASRGLDEALRIDIDAMGAEGPFALVLGVDAMTIEILLGADPR